MTIRDAGMFGLLVCLTFAAYLPAMQGSPVWDDNNHLTRPELQSLAGLGRIWFDLGATAQYYPLLHSAFWVEHTLWGDAVLGYHLTNIALHALSACLVVMIVKRLALPGAWLAGFLFALHPINADAVAWISEQKSTLSGAFYLASAFVYLHFDRTRRKSQYALALGLFVMALLSKTVTATLPAALLVVFWWQRGRLDAKRDVLPLVPWFALAVPMGLFTAWVERKYIGAKGTEFALTAAQRIVVAGRSIWFYIEKLLFPADLAFQYPRWKIDSAAWQQDLYPLAAIALGLFLWSFARRNRGPIAGFLFFAGTLFPVLGFLNVYPFRYSYVADHFQYLASLGIIIPVASVITTASRPGSFGRVGGIASVVLLGVLAVLTWQQSGTYQDDETLYRASLARYPGSWLAHNNLGSILVLRPGEIDNAIGEYEAAIKLEPAAPEPHFNLGAALVRTGSDELLPKAIAEYDTALRLKPDYAEAHNNLGNALSHVPGRLPEAIVQFEAARQLKPGFAQVHLNLGNAFAKTPGRLPDAIVEYQEAFRLRPDYAEAHFNLGNVFTQIPGRLNDAMAQYEEALRIRPDFEPARQAIERLKSDRY